MHDVKAAFASGDGIEQSMCVSMMRLFYFHIPLSSI